MERNLFFGEFTPDWLRGFNKRFHVGLVDLHALRLGELGDLGITFDSCLDCRLGSGQSGLAQQLLQVRWQLRVNAL